MVYSTRRYVCNGMRHILHIIDGFLPPQNLCVWDATDDDKDSDQLIAGKSPDKKCYLFCIKKRHCCYKEKHVIHNYKLHNQHNVMYDNMI